MKNVRDPTTDDELLGTESPLPEGFRGGNLGVKAPELPGAMAGGMSFKKTLSKMAGGMGIKKSLTEMSEKAKSLGDIKMLGGTRRRRMRKMKMKKSKKISARKKSKAKKSKKSRKHKTR